MLVEQGKNYCSALFNRRNDKMDNVQMYYIKDDYIDYLRKTDSKVPFNKNQTRPYVGVIIEHNNVKYFAPLSSPKPKHQNMRNNIDIYKINNGKLGIVNLNNMIPINMSNVIKINFNKQPDHYKNLLQDQIRFINNDKFKVFKKASKLIDLYIKNQIPNIANRCCNFTELEKKCIDYERSESISIQKEVAATKTSINETQSTKDKIINLYKKEFPSINHISEKAAKIIEDLNKEHGQALTIKALKEMHYKAGKDLESNNTDINKELFNKLDEVYSSLSNCSYREKQLEIHEVVSQKNIVKSKELEL